MIFRHGADWREKMGERAPLALAAALRFVESQYIARKRAEVGL